MTRKQALIEMRDMVINGRSISFNSFAATFPELKEIGSIYQPLFCRWSLDAVKALHEAVSPGWRVTHAFGLIAGEVAKFNLTDNSDPSKYAEGKSTTPARAWLIAILSALIKMEDE